MRRVVVTGLGAVTPLGVGIRQIWNRLLAGESGIVSVASRQPQARWKELTSTIAGVVPVGSEPGQWRASDWLSASEQRRMSTFTQYAIAASDMALKDAGWDVTTLEDMEATGVCLGSGIGNLDEIYETSLAHHTDVSCHKTLAKIQTLTLHTTGIQESLTFVRPQDTNQPGSRSHRHEIRLPGAEPRCHYSLHHRRTFHWRCLQIYCHGRRRCHGGRRL